MNKFKSFAVAVAFLAAAAAQATTVGVFSTGNSQQRTADVAAWLQASGAFTSVTGLNGNSFSASQFAAYDQVLFFTNGGGDSTGNGDALALFAQSGKRLVVTTFSWAQQGGNTLGGNFISGGYSPFTSFGGSAYTSVTMAGNDGSSFFSGVSSLNGLYHDRVQASAGSILRGTWSDGTALLATKGNVVGVNLFPDDSWGQVSGNNRQLIINALSVSAVPEPETYAMLLAGLGLMGAVARRRKAKQA